MVGNNGSSIIEFSGREKARVIGLIQGAVYPEAGLHVWDTPEHVRDEAQTSNLDQGTAT